MKKLSLAIFFGALSFSGWSQYKKAEFFSSQGRTVGVGATSLMMGDGKGSPIGFYIEGCRENAESRIFSFGNLVVIPGYKFSFQTPVETYGQPSKDITVTGKTTTHFLYQFNIGYFLLKQENDQRKFRPFITAGTNVLLGGRAKEVTYEDGYVINRQVGGQSFSFGLRGGLGCMYDLTKKISLKLDGGYTYQVNIDGSGRNSSNTYYLFTTHTSVSLGVRYSISSE